MTNTTKETLTSHRARIGGLALALVAALGVGIWMMPASADVEQTAATIDTAITAEGSSDEERARLRDDVKEARELAGAERREALKGIRDDARDGKYGVGVEQRLERRGAHRAAFFALLPAELQSDLEALKDADPEERKAMREEIREKALDGGYGENVQEAWKLLDEHRRGKTD